MLLYRRLLLVSEVLFLARTLCNNTLAFAWHLPLVPLSLANAKTR